MVRFSVGTIDQPSCLFHTTQTLIFLPAQFSLNLCLENGNSPSDKKLHLAPPHPLKTSPKVFHQRAEFPI